MIELHTRIGDLLHTIHIAKATQRIGTTARNLIHLSPHLSCDPVHLLVDLIIAVGIHKPNLDPHQMIQDLIAFPCRHTALLQYQNTTQAHLQSTGRRQHRMITLRLAGGHHQIISLVLRILQQILQLTNLVATQRNPTQIVTLDPHIRA